MTEKIWKPYRELITEYINAEKFVKASKIKYSGQTANHYEGVTLKKRCLKQKCARCRNLEEIAAIEGLCKYNYCCSSLSSKYFCDKHTKLNDPHKGQMIADYKKLELNAKKYLISRTDFIDCMEKINPSMVDELNEIIFAYADKVHCTCTHYEVGHVFEKVVAYTSDYYSEHIPMYIEATNMPLEFVEK